ncbi:hypothetical protein M427DRAFT_56082 [Gonapodya prolifera JEL478]|uniref:Uncharacterized protein n=1 Tax=Gonapodya prolifera (strain JEL478) TaxID=1344416 RepID=A0A139AIF6_GONPJ|nr:hypothetical protein M427DRAFT_56082 [Gonapodya prolifera JEL478]|eukprot:KXS16205.1 hypothetical protein M427DRAFT_56082 [Gonapodya prolifera JEL478]
MFITIKDLTQSINALAAAMCAGTFPRLRRIDFMYNTEDLMVDREEELEVSLTTTTTRQWIHVHPP